MDQKPSIGRIVHIHENEELSEKPCLAAIITAVNSDGTIDATVFYSNTAYAPVGRFFGVKELQPDQKIQPNMTSTWHWPERV